MLRTGALIPRMAIDFASQETQCFPYGCISFQSEWLLERSLGPPWVGRG